MIAMEATIFTGWIYDHLLPHADKVKVANPLMSRAIAAAKRKNDRIDAGKIADCLRYPAGVPYPPTSGTGVGPFATIDRLSWHDISGSSRAVLGLPNGHH